MFPVSLTIAGSDPSGGAGIQADLKTFHQHGVYGTSVITLLTVQNTKSVELVHTLSPDLVLKQLQAVLSDIPPQAAKTGALGDPEVIDAISLRAAKFDFPLVIDPVMISKHGAPLLSPDATHVLRKQLLPYAYLVTPNIPEAEQLSEWDISNVAAMEKAAVTISKLGPRNVLVKGGHLESEATDVLYYDKQLYRFPSPRIETTNTHGTGCVYSAAITAHLSCRKGLLPAVKSAKSFVTAAIQTNPGLGMGAGPINMHARIE
ncbi:MAG: bifunctional hydroxymethylpyrimidine kinase/phosphomethylpyrimidine kinase [Bdellovibrionota bacterium]